MNRASTCEQSTCGRPITVGQPAKRKSCLCQCLEWFIPAEGTAAFSSSAFLLFILYPLFIPPSHHITSHCTAQHCTALPDPHIAEGSNRAKCNRTGLYCNELYYTILYCNIIYCTVLYCAVNFCTVLYCNIIYCTVLCWTGPKCPKV